MRIWGLLLGWFGLVASAFGSQPARSLEQLKILYIGDPNTPRATDFTGFLKQKVGRIELAARDGFKSTQAHEFDVVLLDWPQSDSARDDRKSGRSPLGDREAWNKPTVLLGSAGLNLAVVWKVRGGSG
jgi:hypothetical protein